MKKRLSIFLALAGLLAGCAINPSNNAASPTDVVSSKTQPSDLERIYKLYADDGGTLTYEQWLAIIQGESGKDGLTIRTGQGEPSADIGQNGDSYIDTDTWDLYAKSGGSWAKSGNLKGIQGDQGPKGNQGDQGDTGPQGSQGPKGDQGDTGPQGSQGEQGPKGDQGDPGVTVVSIEKTGSDGLIDTYTITYSDGHTSTFVVVNGEQGEQGIQGLPGKDGTVPVITVGDNGNWFVDGVDTGIKAQGPKGDKGEDGVFVVSIEKTGTSGLVDVYTITYSDGHTSSFVITNGAQGDQGIQGVPGPDGHAPVVRVGKNGNWYVDGKDTGIKAQGPKGEQGDKGDTGDTGAQGVSVVSIEKTGSEGLTDTYTITYSDGSTSTFQITNGRKGDKGDQGDKGDKGEQGDTGQKGADGKSAYEIYKQAHPEYEGDEQQWLDDLVNGRLGNQDVYTVTFDLGYDQLSFTQKVNRGEKAKKPESPVRKGYNFLDWVDENGDHWVFNGFPITEDITLYAVWSDPVEYVVKFVNNGGEVLEIDSYHYGDTAVYRGLTPVAENQDPHTFYVFSGWDKSLFVTGDMVLTAQYETTYVAMKAYYYDYDGETLLATVPLAEGEAPHYDGETPVRQRDTVKKLQFEFDKWVKAEETSTSVKYVAKYAFCTDGLDFKGNEVTYYHGSALDVIIPSDWNGNRITTISKGAFADTSVVSVAIPDTITSIGESAFNGCSSLSSLTIPKSVVSIGHYAFSQCASLPSITIPASVTSFGNSALAGCTSLASVTFQSITPHVGENIFGSSLSRPDLKIFVPAEGLAAYKNLDQFCWSYFGDWPTIEAYDALTEVILTVENNGTVVNQAPEADPGANAAIYKVTLAIGDKLVVKGDGVALPLGDSELTEFTCTVAGEHTVYVSKEYKVYVSEPVAPVGDHVFAGTKNGVALDLVDLKEEGWTCLAYYKLDLVKDDKIVLTVDGTPVPFTSDGGEHGTEFVAPRDGTYEFYVNSATYCWVGVPAAPVSHVFAGTKNGVALDLVDLKEEGWKCWAYYSLDLAKNDKIVLAVDGAAVSFESDDGALGAEFVAPRDGIYKFYVISATECWVGIPAAPTPAAKALKVEVNGAEASVTPEENPGDDAAVYKITLAVGDKLVVKGDGVALPLGDSELTEFTCTVAGEHTVYVSKEYKVYLVVPAS